MSLITTPMRSLFQACTFSEQPYSSPWDLKIQEEKFQQISLVYNRKALRRSYSARPISRKQSFTPPAVPPLPPGGLIPSLPKNNAEKCDASRYFLSASKSSLNNRAQPIEPVENPLCLNSLPKIRNIYDRPWDALQTSLIKNLHTRSLQKIANLKQHYSSPTFPTVFSCQYPEDRSTIPIDQYFWYHYTMSRREAESVLESRPSGSFLVRQSESGNQNDYSLSIQTTKGCVHMRISYSNGFYILGECSRPFSSISAMIKYFTHTTVPIRGAAHMKLGLPVLRWEILSSSLSNTELL